MGRPNVDGTWREGLMALAGNRQDMWLRPAPDSNMNFIVAGHCWHASPRVRLPNVGNGGVGMAPWLCCFCGREAERRWAVTRVAQPGHGALMARMEVTWDGELPDDPCPDTRHEAIDVMTEAAHG